MWKRVHGNDKKNLPRDFKKCQDILQVAPFYTTVNLKMLIKTGILGFKNSYIITSYFS